MRYAGLGFQLLGSIGLFGWLGYLLDRYLEFKFPVFLLSFVLIAFVGNMVLIYRSINTKDRP